MSTSTSSDGRRFVGIRDACGATFVGNLAADESQVTVVAELEEFWSDPGRRVEGGLSGAVLSTSEVVLVPPVLPSARVICIGLNYLEHVAEGTYASEGVPSHPTLFARWPVSLAVSGTDIPVPLDEDGLDWEGEVVAYVGSPLRNATPEEALAAVVGYSVFNDVTARRAQKLTSQWTLGKNADASGPLGPLIPAAAVGDLRDGLEIRTRVNGEVVQEASTDQMVYTVGETLAHISRTFRLNPGDLLATGTPSGVGYSRNPAWLLQPGDTVEVEVERLGAIRNRVVASAPARPPAARSRDMRLRGAAVDPPP